MNLFKLMPWFAAVTNPFKEKCKAHNKLINICDLEYLNSLIVTNALF